MEPVRTPILRFWFGADARLAPGIPALLRLRGPEGARWAVYTPPPP